MTDLSSAPHFLTSFLNPQSVAIYGANENVPNNMGSIQLLTLIDNGYQGAIYPIHPTLDTIFGLKTYKKISEVPGPVDLVEIILPKRLIPSILEEIGQKGTKNVILVTAGFREMDDQDGRGVIQDMAQKYGLHILGPNCIGVMNAHTHVHALDVPCVMNTTVQTYAMPPGNVAIASQSGTFVSHVFMLLEERNLRLSKTLSLGNEANIDLCDCLELFADDPETAVILLYIEEIKRARKFFELAQQISPKKPIVVLYVGGSKGGAQAIHSHTGSLAGNDTLYDGMFHQAGIIRVKTFEELLDAAVIFSHFIPHHILPSGNRLAIMTNSGGPGATMSDQATRYGLEMPPPQEALHERLLKKLPPTGQVGNPLDFTFSLNPIDFHYVIPRLYAKSGQFDALITYGAFGSKFFRFLNYGVEYLATDKPQQIMVNWMELVEENIKKCGRMMQKLHFPVVHVNFVGPTDPIFKMFSAHHQPVFRYPHQAVKAIKYLCEYAAFHHAKK
jgi:acyl-CoA synthetase (NDP forming)